MDHQKRYILLILFQFLLLSAASVGGADWGWSDYDEDYRYESPVMSYLIEESGSNVAYVCTSKDRCVTTCAADYKDGCVCYNDGNCYEQRVNRCHQCTDPSVFAVFEGSECPRRQPPYCDRYYSERRRHRHYRRSYRGQDSLTGAIDGYCTEEKIPSCVCSKNGDCYTKNINVCKHCRFSKYLAVFINSTCPDNSLYAVCNKTDGSNPPSTTCNYPTAYQCQKQDRKSKTCNLISSPQACVCYSDGRCTSQPASACSCQQSDIVSVYTGSFCPTNCSASNNGGSQVEEEGEASKPEEEGEAPKTQEEETSENKPSNNSKNEPTPINNSTTTNNSAPTNNSTPTNNSFISDCTHPGAYVCQDNDRIAGNCSEARSNSCVCNHKGKCMSIYTNICHACKITEVATVYTGDFCPSSCDRNSSTPAPTDNTPSNSLPSASNAVPNNTGGWLPNTTLPW